jgi:integrase
MVAKTTTAERRATLLRNHPDIASWYKDHGKIATATVQLEQLELFLRRTGLDATELVNLAQKGPKQLKGVVGDYVRTEQTKGRKAKYILNVWWGVRAFLASVDAAPMWNPKVEKTEADEEDLARTIPTHDQLRQIATSVKSSRDRAVVYLLASSGVRIGVLATQFEPADGLRLKHLPELKLREEPKFEKMPFTIRVPAHLSKGKNAYYTFGSHEAADAVLSMLRERIRGGEALTLESPLILPDTRGRRSERRAKDGASFMVRKALAQRIKLAMERVSPWESRWSAHTLRAWFSTQLESCESRGLISRTRREFFMGHSLGADGNYNVERPLSSEKIDELRASYKRCEPSLTTVSMRGEAPDSATISKMLLMRFGYGEEELAAIDLADLAAVQELVSKKMGLRAEPQSKQRMVSEGELPRYLEEGWTVVASLASNQVVLSPPLGAYPGVLKRSG